MKLRAEQLTQHIQRQLAPIYLVSGDEILLVQEILDKIRQAAQQANYQERIIIEADNTDAWHNFSHESRQISLFSHKRVIECRLSPGKLSEIGNKALLKYSEQPAPDTILLIVAAKLTQPQQNSLWFKTIDKCGVIIQLWPIPRNQFPAWLDQRLRTAGLQTDQKGLQILAQQVEGNLLAAAQEIEKLSLLFGASTISCDQIASAISGNNRYDIFTLVDSVLMGEVQRSLQILHNLRSEGTEPAIVLWGLTRELRSLVSMMTAQNQGMSLTQIYQNHGVWEQRKVLIQRAMERLNLKSGLALIQFAAYIDRIIKGIVPGKAWSELEQLCLGVSVKMVLNGDLHHYGI